METRKNITARPSWKTGSRIPGMNLGKTKINRPHSKKTRKYFKRTCKVLSSFIIQDHCSYFHAHQYLDFYRSIISSDGSYVAAGPFQNKIYIFGSLETLLIDLSN